MDSLIQWMLTGATKGQIITIVLSVMSSCTLAPAISFYVIMWKLRGTLDALKKGNDDNKNAIDELRNDFEICKQENDEKFQIITNEIKDVKSELKDVSVQNSQIKGRLDTLITLTKVKN